MSEESLRRRFFSGGQPNELIIDYLVHIDYVDHFAWLVLDARGPTEGVATARYIRQHDAPERAEVAFAVKDAYQGRGIGGLLLGAIGAAASVSGITRFTGSLLSDNEPMRTVLSKGAASFAFGEPGVTSAELAVEDAASILDEGLRHELQVAARDIVTAAGLALTRPSDTVQT
jgi:GNAT superfamily N-acetyltransferase